MKTLRQWLCWRRVPKRLADGSMRIGKVPLNPVKNILLAGWQQERHWLTFVQASKYLSSGRCDGVGFVFNGMEPFSGIDLDKCISDGVIEPWAQTIVDRCSSYTERSPSGTGLRIFIMGKPNGIQSKAKKALGNGSAVEVFAGAGCFLTVTGDAIVAVEMKDNQTAIDWLMETYFPRSSSVPKPVGPSPQVCVSSDDQVLMAKARNAKNGALFRSLYDAGDADRYGGDKSAADFALCVLLLYWCDGAADRADRLFRLSALMRPKWDERHGQMTYGEQTMQRAAQRQR